MVNNIDRSCKLAQIMDSMAALACETSNVVSNTGSKDGQVNSAPRDATRKNLEVFVADSWNLDNYLHLQHLVTCLEDYIYFTRHQCFPDVNTPVDGLNDYAVWFAY